MYKFLLLGAMFLQLPTAEDWRKTMTPEMQLQRAEGAIKIKQDSVEAAVKAEADWHSQADKRTQDKLALIEKVKTANHLDATWSWDDATHKFVQKK